MPSAELGVFVPQLIDHAARHRGPQQRGYEGPGLYIQPQGVSVVVLLLYRVLLGPGNNDVQARDHTFPVRAACFLAVEEGGVDEFLDDHVSRFAGLGICEGKDQAHRGQRDWPFHAADGTLVLFVVFEHPLGNSYVDLEQAY